MTYIYRNLKRSKVNRGVVKSLCNWQHSFAKFLLIVVSQILTKRCFSYCFFLPPTFETENKLGVACVQECIFSKLQFFEVEKMKSQQRGRGEQ